MQIKTSYFSPTKLAKSFSLNHRKSLGDGTTFKMQDYQCICSIGEGEKDRMKEGGKEGIFESFPKTGFRKSISEGKIKHRFKSG